MARQTRTYKKVTLRSDGAVKKVQWTFEYEKRNRLGAIVTDEAPSTSFAGAQWHINKLLNEDGYTVRDGILRIA